MDKGYQYYADRVFEQAMQAPDVQKDTADEPEHHHGYDIDKAVSYSDRQ